MTQSLLKTGRPSNSSLSASWGTTDASTTPSQQTLTQLPNPNSSEWKSLDTIRTDLEEFLHVPGGAELWAWVGCYDHVVLAQLWGDMPALPRHIPRFTRELKQYWEFAGKPQLPDLESGKHNALEDARHNVRKFQACMAALPIGAKGHVLPPN